MLPSIDSFLRPMKHCLSQSSLELECYKKPKQMISNDFDSVTKNTAVAVDTASTNIQHQPNLWCGYSVTEHIVDDHHREVNDVAMKPSQLTQNRCFIAGSNLKDSNFNGNTSNYLLTYQQKKNKPAAESNKQVADLVQTILKPHPYFMTSQQKNRLLEYYNNVSHYVKTEQVSQLATELNLKPVTISNWFSKKRHNDNKQVADLVQTILEPHPYFLTSQQKNKLLEYYNNVSHYVKTEQVSQLSTELNLKPTTIRYWFAGKRRNDNKQAAESDKQAADHVRKILKKTP